MCHPYFSGIFVGLTHDCFIQTKSVAVDQKLQWEAMFYDYVC